MMFYLPVLYNHEVTHGQTPHQGCMSLKSLPVSHAVWYGARARMTRSEANGRRRTVISHSLMTVANLGDLTQE